MYFVYLLRSVLTGKTYVGVTNKDVNFRLKEHNQGKNNWTSKYKPFHLIYYESFYCEKDALHRELFLKSGVGNKVIRALVKEFDR